MQVGLPHDYWSGRTLSALPKLNNASTPRQGSRFIANSSSCLSVTYGPTPARTTGPLHPAEMAQAAVMAALCAACAVIAVIVPFGQVFSLLGTVPMGLLAYRYRIRVLIAAMVAGGMIAFLVAGMGGFMTVLNCAYIGGLTGVIKRRGRGWPTMLVASLLAGAAFGAFAVGGAAG